MILLFGEIVNISVREWGSALLGVQNINVSVVMILCIIHCV